VIGRETKHGSIQVRFQVLTAVSMKTSVFLCVAPCSVGELDSAINSTGKHCSSFDTRRINLDVEYDRTRLRAAELKYLQNAKKQIRKDNTYSN
jgi:hypothetical protein